MFESFSTHVPRTSFYQSIIYPPHFRVQGSAICSGIGTEPIGLAEEFAPPHVADIVDHVVHQLRSLFEDRMSEDREG